MTAYCAHCKKKVTVTPGTGSYRRCNECGRSWGSPRPGFLTNLPIKPADPDDRITYEKFMEAAKKIWDMPGNPWRDYREHPP